MTMHLQATYRCDNIDCQQTTTGDSGTPPTTCPACGQ
jgi:DNA-directed RNA polymerase subunit RPC12/RpoP